MCSIIRLFAMMRNGILILLCAFGLGCSDTFNLPEYGATIEDSESPVISLSTPEENFVYRDLLSIPVSLTVTDNLELDAVQLQINPSNVVGDGISFTRTVNDSIFRFDTTYTFPPGDSIVFDVLIIANDLVNNTSLKSLSFTAIK